MKGISILEEIDLSKEKMPRDKKMIAIACVIVCAFVLCFLLVVASTSLPAPLLILVICVNLYALYTVLFAISRDKSDAILYKIALTGEDVSVEFFETYEIIDRDDDAYIVVKKQQKEFEESELP